MDLISIVALCIAIFIILVVQFAVIATLAAHLLIHQSSSLVDHEAEKKEVPRNQVTSLPAARTQDHGGVESLSCATHDQQRSYQNDDSSSMYSNPEPLIPQPARGRGNAGC
jgi:hypothetical protein